MTAADGEGEDTPGGGDEIASLTPLLTFTVGEGTPVQGGVFSLYSSDAIAAADIQAFTDAIGEALESGAPIYLNNTGIPLTYDAGTGGMFFNCSIDGDNNIAATDPGSPAYSLFLSNDDGKMQVYTTEDIGGDTLTVGLAATDGLAPIPGGGNIRPVDPGRS